MDALEIHLDQNKKLEEEITVNKLGILKKIVVGSLFVGGILILFHSFGGDLPGVVGDIGNSLGNQISTVGEILNKNTFDYVNTTNRLISADHLTILSWLANLEGNVLKSIKSLSVQIARLTDPRVSCNDFFSKFYPEDAT